MKQRSFFLKLFLSNLLLVIAILLLGGAVAYPWLDRTFRAEHWRHQEELATMATGHFQESWEKSGGHIDPQCGGLLKDSSIRLTVVAADGQVLCESQADTLTMGNHKTPSRPEILQALEGKDASVTRSSETTGEEYLYIAHPLRSQGRVVGAVRVAMPIQAITADESFIREALLLGAAGSVLGAVVLGLITGWMWHLPLRRVTQTAREIAAGSLHKRAQIDGTRELAQLAMALNEMRDSLASQIQTIAAQREDLQTVLSNLGEGVLALDMAGRVVLINRTAGGMLGVEPASTVGKNLQTVVRLADVVDLYNQAAGGKPAQKLLEADIGGVPRTLEVHAARLAGNSGIAGLLVIRDVTDITRTAAIKAEFVANASHELRTPLATLRAAVDSMEGPGPMDEESSRRYHEILNRHVGRLENMTRDLLDLHIVESGKMKLRAEELDAAQLGNWALTAFAARAEEKGVTLCLEPSAAGKVVADRKLLELILQNLLDNAIKFTPAQGKVSLRLQPKEKAMLITVSDNGCGIRREDQGRVFERFFQVDAARSGDAKARGTGLGLAIVKHAAERLGAKVELQSELGKGTTVTVLIPNAPAAA